MSRFVLTDLPIEGVRLVARRTVGDHRGFLARVFCGEELKAAGWSAPIAQINHTYTAKRGTVRGMHFQRPPHAEMKLVTCIRGSVFDVALDVRTRSPTYLRWCSATLSAENGAAMLLPEGFAHGFQALSDDVELLYCHSRAYNAAAEGGANPRDSRIAIDWPLPIAELSDRDAGHPLSDAGFQGVDA